MGLSLRARPLDAWRRRAFDAEPKGVSKWARNGSKMPTQQRILKSADFGVFEPELKRAFQAAFHFGWDVGKESPEEQERRRRFSVISRAARSLPDPEPTAGLVLMRECFALHLKICAYLNPEDALHGQLATIAATISKVGKRIARLPVRPKKSSRRGSPSVLALRSDWGALEDGLRAANEDYSAGTVAEELARLRDAASRANAQLANIGALLKELSVGGKNQVVAAEQAVEVKAIAASVAQISLELKAFRQKCAPPVDDEAKFRAYFERLAQSIPVQSWYEGSDGVAKLCTEVPWGALPLHRDLPERRGAVLESLCTWDTEFFSLLPGAVRRGHGAPATTGGRGKHNWVLNGITAALVLLELVDAVPVVPKASGKGLFKATIKRVERWIDGQTSSGGFYVEATAQPGTRAGHRHGRPLQSRYPIMPKASTRS